MKLILRFLVAITIGSTSLTSINACSNILSWLPPQSDDEFAILLGWYADHNISKIEQKLQYNVQKDVYEIINNDKIINNTNFKNQLLINDDNGFSAKNMDCVRLLNQLGFNSGDVKTTYSEQDVDNISKLKASIVKVNPGKINITSNDYEIDSGTVEIRIKINNKILKTYTLDTLNNNSLNIPLAASQLVNQETIALTKSCGFAVNALTSNCTLNLNSNVKQHQWTAFLNFLSIEPFLTWTDTSMCPIEKFSKLSVMLQVNFGKIIVVKPFYCGTPE